jgi:lactate dehydrogenase-like 2-hydroxyacid dehydrogenase
MEYTTDFEGLVRSSDMVISHAGMSDWKGLFDARVLADMKDPGQS